jgi:DNA-directed RNA polymerase specialized sigma24 family protein
MADALASRQRAFTFLNTAITGPNHFGGLLRAHYASVTTAIPKKGRRQMSPAAAQILETQIYLIIRNTIPKTARPIGSEDYEELVQDTLASAAAMIEAMEKSGRKLIPNSIAYYSIQRTKSGRRSYGHNLTDVMFPGYQMEHEGSVCSMQSPVSGEDENVTVGDLIASRTEDISARVLREIDWAAFLESLDARKRTIVEELMLGTGTSEIARRLKVSAPRIVQLKREIAQHIKEYMGDSILHDIASESVWQRDIRCLRERNEWKHLKLDCIDDPEAANINEALFG